MPIERLIPAFSLEAERLEALKQIVPEAFADGLINWETLKEILAPFLEGESEDAEHFGLNWPGKRQARRLAAMPSKGTLAPVPGEGVNEESTQNIFIEGDNLEVLKLLQKSYAGRIKMIYIDPPYNTGNDFIYKDDYSEPLESYLKRTGQADEEGKLLVSNTKADGRFHSNWLNMMYPRLRLARNLLREDGVMFVSIADHEVHNLRQILSETFGEENFVACVIWQKIFSPKNTARHFSEDHDYILVYAKNAGEWMPQALPRSEDADARYSNPDNDPRGPWTSGDLTARNYYSEGQYEVTSPGGKKFKPSVGNYWRVKYDRFIELDRDKRIWWGVNGNNMPRLKRFLSEVKQGIVPQTLWKHEEVGNTQEAKKELLEFVKFANTDNVLDSVKPTRLIQRMLQIATSSEEDIVLDFFAGSASTAHAVIRQNRADGARRRFICVQAPEGLPKPETKLKTLVDIGKERIRNVIAQAESEDKEKLSYDYDNEGRALDLGFKVLKLTYSNFKAWRDVPANADLQQLHLSFDSRRSPFVDGWKENEVLAEILLLEGFPLHSAVRRDDSFTRNKVFRVDSDFCAHRLFVSLDDDVMEETIRQVAGLPKEDIFICLDSALSDTDKAALDDSHPNTKTM